MKERNPFLVLLWSFGLYLLVHTTQYIYFWLGSAATGAGFGEIAGGEVETYLTVLLRGAVGLILGIPVLLIVVKYLWRRPLGWLGLRLRAGHLLGGAALGLAAVVLVVALLSAFRVARITAYPSRLTGQQLGAILAGQCCWALFISMLEETVFRGMATREFALRWGWPAATLVGGLYFAAVHLIGIVPIIDTPLIIGVLIAGLAASVLFTALYIRSGSLWLPIGFHAGWNLALSALFGTTMSGREVGFGLFRTELSGPRLLTGGEFGVELSAISVIVTAVAAACVLWKRGPSIFEKG